MVDPAGVVLVGEPVTYAVGLLVLVLVAFTGPWILSMVTVAHEGGHAVVAVLAGRVSMGFRLEPNADGATGVAGSRFFVGNFFIGLAGFLAPPLVGLGGAVAIAEGKAWSVLWAAVILGIAAYIHARESLANVYTFLVLAGLVATALFASALVQTMVAVGLVWVMLIGGLYQAVRQSRADGTDAHRLARCTLLPRLFWHGLWVLVGLACLYKGTRLLLGI
jgi:hypothetical protein